MDSIIYDMDSFSIHVGPLPRRFPAELRVQSIGFMPEKRDRIQHSFSSMNFSLVLEGEGTYTVGGREIHVEAPCVITQWPEAEMDYGPTGETGRWSELFITFPSEAVEVVERRRLFSEETPYWPIHNIDAVQRHVQELHELISGPASRPGFADRLDRVAEMIVMESRLGSIGARMGAHEKVIREIQTYVLNRLGVHHDFDELATQHGLGPATFRRHWSRYVRDTPARYVMLLRIREACRQLVETELPVHEISRSLGYQDPLYFSRRFKSVMKITATEYRRANPGIG